MTALNKGREATSYIVVVPKIISHMFHELNKQVL